MRTTKKAIKIIVLFINLVLIALMLQFGYIWFFSEAKTETIRVIIVLVASGNLYCLTSIFVNLMLRIARNSKNLVKE